MLRNVAPAASWRGTESALQALHPRAAAAAPPPTPGDSESPGAPPPVACPLQHQVKHNPVTVSQ